MRERGDFYCFHEPFLHYYYLQRAEKTFPHFRVNPEHPVSYADTRDMILARAAKSPVFVKDMSYYVIPELLEDVAFCRRVRHCFLIRHPQRSILSYYKLDNDISCDEIGLEAQWQHFEGLRHLGINDNIVLEAETIQVHPETSLQRFWSALGLEHREQALQWQQREIPPDWRYVEGWHTSVSDSSGIRPENIDADSLSAEFDQMCRKAPHLRGYLQHHLRFFQQLQRHSLYQ